MLRSIQKELRRGGFDLCHPIHTSWYNALIEEEGLVENGTLRALPAPPAGASLVSIEDGNNGTTINCNALLIGNTKNIWPVFLEWLAAKVEEKKGEADTTTNNTMCTEEKKLVGQIVSPFDAFVEEAIPQALQHACKGNSKLISYELFWSNGNRQKFTKERIIRSSDESTTIDNNDSAQSSSNNNNNASNYHCFKNEEHSFLVSMQRVANTTGEYWHDTESTKLCVHPEYGTWTAFRAIVVFETETSSLFDSSSSSPPCAMTKIPPAPMPPSCPCPVPEDEIKMAKAVFDYALKMSSSSSSEGEDDKQHNNGYGATLNLSWAQLCKYLHGTVCSGSKWDDVPDTMKPWIQLRDCFSVGRERWKYRQEQLLYHYTKDPEILSMELDRFCGEGRQNINAIGHCEK